MAEPVLQTVLAFLKARLRAQLVEPTATFDLVSLVEERPNLADAQLAVEMPAAYLWTGEEVHDHDDAFGRTIVHAVLNVIVLRQVESNVAQAGRLMVADVVRALTSLNHAVTHATGPTVVACFPQKSVTWNGLSSSRAGGHVAFEVVVRTAFGDPCAVG